MARAETNRNNWSNALPGWLGYFLDADDLMPAGGRIDPATITANTAGRKYVDSGSIVGRTQAMIDADAPFRKAVAGDAQIFIVAYEVRDANINADIELVRPTREVIVKWNFLPDQAHYTLIKADVDSRYTTVKGV